MQTQFQPINNATADKIFAAYPLEAKAAMLAYGASNLIVGKTTATTGKKTAAKAPKAATGKKGTATAPAASASPGPTPLQTRVLERIRSRGSAGIQQGDIVLEGVRPNSIGRAVAGLKKLKLATSRGPEGNLVWFAEQEQQQQAA